MGGDDHRRRLGDASGRGRRGVLRRFRRHAVEARRQDRRGDLVASGLGLHGDRRRHRAHQPVVAGNTLVVGDLEEPEHARNQREDRRLRWITQVHPDPKGIMTGSPVLFERHDLSPASPRQAHRRPGATFRGAIVALDAQTGRILWQSYSLPDNGGVAGRLRGRDDVLAAGRRPFGATRLRHVRAAVHGAGECHRVPRGARRLHRGVRAAGLVLEVHCRVRSEDGRAAMVVPGAGPRSVAAGVRQPAGRR